MWVPKKIFYLFLNFFSFLIFFLVYTLRIPILYPTYTQRLPKLYLTVYPRIPNLFYDTQFLFGYISIPKLYPKNIFIPNWYPKYNVNYTQNIQKIYLGITGYSWVWFFINWVSLGIVGYSWVSRGYQLGIKGVSVGYIRGYQLSIRLIPNVYPTWYPNTPWV